MSFFQKKNNAKTQINMVGDLGAGVLTMVVDDGSVFPSSGDFMITLWDKLTYPDPGDDAGMEIVKCTARATNSLTIVRAQEGTADVAHADDEAAEMLITAEQFSEIEGFTVPTGAVLPWVTDTPPTGWLLSYGQAISQATYAALYAVIGVTFGDPGGGNFNLPNLKGRVPVGYDSGQSEFDAMGETGGEKTHQLTEAELAAHTHSYTRYTGLAGGGAASGGNRADAGDTTGSTGGDAAHNNIQPYITLSYIIKY